MEIEKAKNLKIYNPSEKVKKRISTRYNRKSYICWLYGIARLGFLEIRKSFRNIFVILPIYLLILAKNQVVIANDRNQETVLLFGEDDIHFGDIN
jgi:hypothetical protein